MSAHYVIGLDQSTSSTKAFLFGPGCELIARSGRSHRQLISPEGWVSHDPMEIHQNALEAIKSLIDRSGIDRRQVAAIGISNQRETALAWNRHTGLPVCDAVVWQCARAKDVCERLQSAGGEETVKASGLPLSPYFTGAKLRWILENVPEAAAAARDNDLCCGTMDSWLIYKLTDGRSFYTDCSNASRTQLLNLGTLNWDEGCCRLFGLRPEWLPGLHGSNGLFGETDLNGYFPAPVPILAAMGDSHAALYGHRCLSPGMAKATYGTGSSVMMNIGPRPLAPARGLACSVGWQMDGGTTYVLEGNVNYTGAVMSWLSKDLGLLDSADRAGELAGAADPRDTTYLVPAFTGLGAPYWCADAKAVLCGMTRRTGRAELVKAAEESIAYQIRDVAALLGEASGIAPSALCADGGGARDRYLMQFQSDLLALPVTVPQCRELSALGAALAAGISAGLYTGRELDGATGTVYQPRMDGETRARLCAGWQHALRLAMQSDERS